MSRHNIPTSILTITATDTFNNVSSPVADVSALNDGTLIFVNPLGRAGLSAAQLLAAKEFEILKVQKSGSTVTGFQSTLNPIPKAGLRKITVAPVSTGRDQYVNVEASTLTCDTDYMIKLQLDSPAFYTENGQKPPVKTYAINSGCCAPCEGCGEGDCKAFWKELRALINADEDNLVTAYLKDPDAKGVGDPDLNDAAVNDLAEGVCPVLQLKTNLQSIAAFCSFPDVYGYPNMVTAVVTALGGFECSSTVTTIQDACHVRHLGVDVREQQAKYEAFYQGSIVRRADRGEAFQGAGSGVDADATASYVAITFDWDTEYSNGMSQYQDPGQTTIYVDATLFDGGEPGTLLLAYLDTAFDTSGFFAGLTISDVCSSNATWTL